MRGLLCRLGGVHQVATATTFNVWARRRAPVRAGLQNAQQTSTCRSSRAIDLGRYMVPGSCSRDEHAQAILEASNARTSCGQRVDTQGFFFRFA